jgi:hypothetical protein
VPRSGVARPRLEEIATLHRVTIYAERVSRRSVEATDQTILDDHWDGEDRLAERNRRGRWPHPRLRARDSPGWSRAASCAKLTLGDRFRDHAIPMR